MNLERRYHKYEDAGFTVRALVLLDDDFSTADFWTSDARHNDPNVESWYSEIVHGLRRRGFPTHATENGPGGHFREFILPPFSAV